MDEHKVEMLGNMIETLLQSKNPVRQVLLRRATTLLRSSLNKFRVKQEPTKVASSGLEAVHADLERLAQNLVRTSSHHH